MLLHRTCRLEGGAPGNRSLVRPGLEADSIPREGGLESRPPRGASNKKGRVAGFSRNPASRMRYRSDYFFACDLGTVIVVVAVVELPAASVHLTVTV